MKLQWKLLILFASASLIITVTLGALLYQQLRKDRIEAVRANTVEHLRHIEFSLSSFFDEAENDILSMAQHESVRVKDDRYFTNFISADEKSHQYKIGLSEQKIIDIFQSFRKTHPYVSSVYMGRENGSFVRSHKRERATRYDSRERPWYVQAKQFPDRVVITEPYPSVTTNDINIGIVKALVDGAHRFYGVVGMDITLVNLTDYILNFSIGPQSGIIIVDRKGIILAAKDRNLLFSPIGSYSKALERILQENIQRDKAIEISGMKHFVYFRESPKIGWKVAILIPARSIEQEIRFPILLTTAGLIFGLFCLSLLSLLGLNLFVIRPLNHLHEETNLIEKTADLGRRVKITSADEIGMLATSFNKMVGSLDTTQRALKEAERDLIEHREHLEDLVKKRTEELAFARDQAQEADRLKSAFLASMSHELRTPLNSIIGFTGILRQWLSGPVNEEQEKQLRMVSNSSHHLLELINEILDLSKIEAGQLKLAPSLFDMGGAIDKAVKLVQPLADKKGLLIKADPVSQDIDPIFHDQQRVEQILINLINNAVKFTEKGEIHVRCTPHAGALSISVRDTGIGMKKEDMGILFERFRQIDTGLSRKYEGTGLGLAICRRLVEMMGGKIMAHSDGPGRGSIFTFTLPRRKGENG